MQTGFVESTSDANSFLQHNEISVTSGLTSFKHFLTTPFFVRRRFGNRAGVQIGSLDWLDARFVLFERWCLPSVLAQTDQDFTWHIYFDTATPAKYLDRITALVSTRANISIRQCDVWSADTIREDVLSETAPNIRWLVTTRLDNDDGLRREFVATLHGEFEERREFLNFPLGSLYYDNKFYMYRHTSNAFLSFVEPVSSALTVWCTAHEDAIDIAPVRQIKSAPAFLQVVHRGNVSNKPRGSRILISDAKTGFEAIFPSDGRVESESRFAILFDWLTNGLSWHVRDLLIGCVKYVRKKLRRNFTR